MAPLSNMHETGRHSIMPTKLPSSSTSSSEGSSSNGIRKQRLQISDSHSFPSSKSQWLKTNDNIISMPITAIPSSQEKHQTSDDSLSPSSSSAPSSPAASSTSTSSVEQQQRQSPSSQASAAPTCSSSDRLWGTVALSLPEGIITNLWCSFSESQKDLPIFESILRKGTNLLELLQGKGSQTLLLNAFCGSSKRRNFYARLKCGDDIRPFEFICEFTPNLVNPSICSATIQILCLESAFKKPSNLADADSSTTTVFTTRHNVSCALIYLDAASIPYLGHFPSEITGKSLFTFIHSDDVSIIQYAHQQLHATNGRLVSTPHLRFVSYSGTVIPVSSEWSAFVNPWTKSVEMIVGRHCINHEASANALSFEQPTLTSAIISPEKFRELDSSIHSIISCPIVSEAPALPEKVIIKQEAMDEQQPQQQPQNLRSYIDNVVENLVITQEEKQQVQEEMKILQEGTPILSYNQINCLENVHRLLKSQSKFLDFDSSKDGMKENATAAAEVMMPASSNNQTILTRELLQQHNRKWEAECKDTWKKRLNMKRIAASSEDQKQPPAKAPRIRSEPQAYSISTAPLPPTSRIISTTSTSPIQGSSNSSGGGNFLPPLPYPPPTPLDQQAWTEYVKLVQLHLQNMATFDHQQNGNQKRFATPPSTTTFQQQQHFHHHHQQRVHQQQQQQQQQHERQLAALAMTFQQVQIPQHHHHQHHQQQQQPSGASSPFNALPSLN